MTKPIKIEGRYYISHNGHIIDRLIGFERSESFFSIVGTCSFSVAKEPLIHSGIFKPNVKTYIYYSGKNSSDEVLVSVGFIESVTDSIKTGLLEIEFVDETARLTDCSWVNEVQGVGKKQKEYNGQYENVNIVSILSSIIGRYIKPSSPFQSHDVLEKDRIQGAFIGPPKAILSKYSYSIDNNSSPFDSIKAIADKNNVIIKSVFLKSEKKDIQQGADRGYTMFLAIDSSSSLNESPMKLEEGVNISDAKNVKDFSRIYSEYIATGQGEISESENLDNSTKFYHKKVISDKFYRPISISSSDGVNEEEIRKICNRSYMANLIASDSISITSPFDHENLWFINNEVLAKRKTMVVAGDVISVSIDSFSVSDKFVIIDLEYNESEISLKLILLSQLAKII